MVKVLSHVTPNVTSETKQVNKYNKHKKDVSNVNKTGMNVCGIRESGKDKSNMESLPNDNYPH